MAQSFWDKILGKKEKKIDFGKKEKTEKEKYLTYALIAAGGAIVLVSFILFRTERTIFLTLNILGGVIALVPLFKGQYSKFRNLKKVESMFPQFLNDVVDSIEAGQTLPQAIKNAADNKYGPLTPYVKKMGIQIDWGIPFDDILEGFAKELRSKLLKRTVATIIQTYRSGGNISDVIKAVSRSIVEIDKIREERKAHTYSQMVTGYTIYFIFLGVIVGLQKFLIPTLLFSGIGDTGAATAQADLTETYAFMFQNLILIQGAFSGLAIGKMSEGSLTAGLKHIVVMVSVGFVVVIALI